MATLTDEEFFEKAKAKYGDKISIRAINSPKGTESEIFYISEFGQEAWDKLLEAIPNYVQAWLVEHKCPECGSPLGGFFGSFEWKVQHGIGYCADCKKTEFRLYHYLAEGLPRIEGFALTGFPDDEVEEDPDEE